MSHLRQTESRAPEHFTALTSMRGIAAWWVVFYHFRDHLPQGGVLQNVAAHGFLAVDLFFVLSGFVLQLSYARYFTCLTLTGVRAFAVARFARIYPLHFFMCIAFLANVLSILVFSKQASVGDRYTLSSYVLNIFLVQAWGLTDGLTWNAPAWSISTEFAAYLLFPAASYFATRFLVRRDVAILALILELVLIAGLFAWKGDSSLGSDIQHNGVPRCVLEVVLGIIVLQFRSQYPALHQPVLLGATGLLLAGLGVFPDHVVFPAACAALILALTQSPSIASGWLRVRPFVFLGEISYSTYLVHYFIKDWTNFLLVGKGFPDWFILFIYSALVLGASVFCYTWIELPGRDRVRVFFGAKPKAGVEMGTARP